MLTKTKETDVVFFFVKNNMFFEAKGLYVFRAKSNSTKMRKGSFLLPKESFSRLGGCLAVRRLCGILHDQPF